MKKLHIVFSVLLVVIATIATAAWYAELPASVPVHWNIEGRPDGFGSRALLWLLGPGLMSGVLVLGLCLPWLSPRRFELETFKATYSYFMLLIICLIGFFHGATLHAILIGALAIHRTIWAGVFVLLILLGNPMGKVKRNFYIGIKTPWTLASARVWHATHRLCARLMVLSGSLGLMALFSGAGSWIVILLASAWGVIAVTFSLIYYKRLEKTGQLEAA